MSNLTLNDYCEFIIDCLHKTAPIEDFETGYYSIRTPDIGRGRLIIENANRVSKETYKKWTIRAIPEVGDLILAREAPVGNIGIIQKNVKVCCGQRTVHIRPDKTKINPDYLTYLMIGDEIQGKIKGYSQGATVAHLNMEDIRALVLPNLPNLPVQNKIAAVLSAYDDLIENNTRRIRILEQMAQAVYHEWFGKVDPQSLPEGWKISTLGHIAEKISNKYENDIHNSMPLLDLARIPRKSCNISDYGKSSELTTSRIVFRKMDILFGAIRPYFHKVVFTPFNGVTNTSVFVIRPINGIPISYLFSILFSVDTVNWANQHSGGTKMPVIQWDVFCTMPIIIPNENSLNKFNCVVEPFLMSISNLILKNANLRQTRDLLLPRLVSGEVGVDGIEIGEEII